MTDRAWVRPTARVVVLDPAGRVLLLGARLSGPDETPGDVLFWYTPGGGVEDGETVREAAVRELAEEIGKAADHWEHLKSYWSSAGFSDERVHVFLATGLHDVDRPDVEEDERIELVAWPLADLDGAIASTEDAKTLVGLYELRRRRAG